MSPEGLFGGVTLLLYLAGSVAYHAHLFAGSERARRAAPWLVAAGAAGHTVAIGAHCLASPNSLFQDPAMPFSLTAYFIALVQVVSDFWRGWASAGSLSIPLAFVGLFYARVRSGGVSAAPAPAGPLLSPHVLALLLGFAAFTLAFCLAVIYLVQSRMLKAKQVRGIFARLPPLESVNTGAHWMATVGFSLLTLGIITGAIAAPERWGPRWYLDARALTSVVAWGIYAAYLGAIELLGWRGRKTTYFLIVGFLVISCAFVISVMSSRS